MPVWTLLIGALRKIPWQLWVLAGVGFSFWWWGNYQYNKGESHVREQWAAARERGKVIVEHLEAEATKINTVVETKVVERVEYIKGNTQVITRQVPVYIPVDAPDLPAGFRVLHDAAATASELPRETSVPGNPVRVADATITITENYDTCHQWKAALDGWETWYQEQLLAWQIAQRRLQ